MITMDGSVLHDEGLLVVLSFSDSDIVVDRLVILDSASVI